MTVPIANSAPVLTGSAGTTKSQTDLQAAARDLEATFLFEMLKSAGLGTARDGFGGRAGEDQFSSFLLQHQADIIAERGGLGLAEDIFQALLEREE